MLVNQIENFKVKSNFLKKLWIFENLAEPLQLEEKKYLKNLFW